MGRGQQLTGTVRWYVDGYEYENFSLEEGDSLWIGSSEDCDIVLTDFGISPYHMEISLDEASQGFSVLRKDRGTVYLEDGSSLPVGEECLAWDGELVYVGQGRNSFGLELDYAENLSHKSGTGNTKTKKWMITTLTGMIGMIVILIGAILFWQSSKKSANANDYVIYHPQQESIAYTQSNESYYNDMLMVYLMEELSEKEKNAIASEIGGKVVGYVSGYGNILQIKVSATDMDGLNAYADQLMTSDKVMYATYDKPGEFQEDAKIDANPWGQEKDKGNEKKPNGNDWWAEAISAYTAWKNYAGKTSDIKVGVIDCGFYLEHEDLAGKITMLNGNTKEDHGTHVAGLIGAADNAVGIRGVADFAQLLCVDYTPAENEALSMSEIQMYILELVNQGANIVNMSFSPGYYYDRWHYKKYSSFKNYDDYRNDFLESRRFSAKLFMYTMFNIYFTGNPEYLMIQSAGNGVNNGGPGYDAKYNGMFCSINSATFREATSTLSEETQEKLNKLGFEYFKNRIIVVGAIKNEMSNQLYEMTYMSNYGDVVDICAPGDAVYSTSAYVPENQNDFYMTKDGTSMAAPIVSGAAAFVWSVNPDLKADEVKEILISTSMLRAADGDGDKNKSYPVLNLANAVQEAYSRRDTEAENDASNEPQEEPEEIPQEEEPEANILEELSSYVTNTIVPQYGVMGTNYLTRPLSAYNDPGTATYWSTQDLGGLLSATIQDFDGDGQLEILTVTFETGSGGTALILRMYEYDTDSKSIIQMAEKRMATPGGYGEEDAIGYRQTGIFAYEYQGEEYIGIDNHLLANESITTLVILQYKDNLFNFVKGAGYQFQGEGDYYVKTADEEPSALLFCAQNPTNNGWTTIRDYNVNSSQTLTMEMKQNYMETYQMLVRDCGLSAEDHRIGMADYSGWPDDRYKQEHLTTPDIYTAQEGDINFIAGMYTYQQDDSLTGLERCDYAGSLDAFR